MAVQLDEQSGEYTPSPEEVDEGMRRWGMPDGEENKVFHWLKQLAENRGYATAVYFPFVWQAVRGVFLCISTDESMGERTSNGMVDNQRRMGGIETPEWLAFSVFFYPGLVFGNFSGFNDPQAQPLGTLANVLDRLCADAGIRDWRRYVFVQPGGWVYAGLRHLLHLLRIPFHAELASGMSKRRIASLDVFVATHTGALGMDPQPMIRWNASHDVTDGIIQYFPNQDHWWHLPVWRSEGQYEHGNIMDYQVDPSIPPQRQGVLAVYAGPGRSRIRGFLRLLARISLMDRFHTIIFSRRASSIERQALFVFMLGQLMDDE